LREPFWLVSLESDLAAVNVRFFLIFTSFMIILTV
jgi:hypothetical protein